MNVTQLIKRVRRSAFLEDGSIDWTDANIVEEMNDAIALFERAVVKAESGVWQRSEYYAVVGSKTSYRLPPRSVTGMIGRVQLSVAAYLDWFELPEVSEEDAVRYEYSDSDMPLRCVIRGESLRLLPTPLASNAYVLRVQYAVRPSRLVLPQVAATSGLVSSVNTNLRTITLAGTMQSVDEAGALTNISTTSAFDVIKPGGWNTVVFSGIGSGLNSSLITVQSDASGVSEANDMSMIAAGDYVRIAEQTDWPALPVEYHRCLADVTAAKILTARGMADRAEELMAHVAPDIKRFESLLLPRVSSGAQALVAPEFV